MVFAWIGRFFEVPDVIEFVAQKEMKSLKQLGFDLTAVTTRDGSRIYQLQTGFRLADQYPFDIFVEETENRFHVWDEGLTYHNLLSINPNLVSGNRMNAIRDIIEVYDVFLTDQGTFEAYGPKEKAADIVCDYLSAMIGLDRWLLDTLPLARPLRPESGEVKQS